MVNWLDDFAGGLQIRDRHPGRRQDAADAGTVAVTAAVRRSQQRHCRPQRLPGDDRDSGDGGGLPGPGRQARPHQGGGGWGGAGAPLQRPRLHLQLQVRGPGAATRQGGGRLGLDRRGRSADGKHHVNIAAVSVSFVLPELECDPRGGDSDSSLTADSWAWAGRGGVYTGTQAAPHSALGPAPGLKVN